MSQNKANTPAPSRMAEAAAAARAMHQCHEKAAVYKDPFALDLTSPGWRFLVKKRWFYHLVAKRLLKILRPVHGQVLARSQFMEEKLFAAIKAGTTQYVILAAGLDSFALRHPQLLKKIHVFEIDHPGTQQLKRKRLSSLGLSLPKNLHFLPANFEQDSVADLLSNAPFDPAQPAFISWLGTTPYLSRSAIFATLQAIASVCAPGTEIVFDYANTHVEPQDQPAVDRLVKFTARRGEQLTTQLDAKTLASEVAEFGFEMLENISQAAWKPEMFQNNQIADLRPISVAWIAHLKLK